MKIINECTREVAKHDRSVRVARGVAEGKSCFLSTSLCISYIDLARAKSEALINSNL